MPENRKLSKPPPLISTCDCWEVKKLKEIKGLKYHQILALERDPVLLNYLLLVPRLRLNFSKVLLVETYTRRHLRLPALKKIFTSANSCKNISKI